MRGHWRFARLPMMAMLMIMQLTAGAYNIDFLMASAVKPILVIASHIIAVAEHAEITIADDSNYGVRFRPCAKCYRAAEVIR